MTSFPHHPYLSQSVTANTRKRMTKAAKLIMCHRFKTNSLFHFGSRYINTYHHSYICYFLKAHQVQPCILMVQLVEKVLESLLLFLNQIRNNWRRFGTESHPINVQAAVTEGIIDVCFFILSLIEILVEKSLVNPSMKNLAFHSLLLQK